MNEDESITAHWSDAMDLAAQTFAANLQKMADIILHAEERFLRSVNESLNGGDSQV